MPDIMNSGAIAFPHLKIYLEQVPKNFSIFGFEVAFYGVIIGIGIMAGVLMAVHEAKKSGQNPDFYWDFSIYAILFSIIGARLYYVIFSWDQYKNNLLSIFNLRGGGLAIYGAVIAAFLTAWIYCRRKKVPFLLLCDTAVPGLVLGQIIGRWGNFMNREAFGEYTDSLFAMRLPIEAVRPWDISQNISSHIIEGTNYIQVHPTYLYESMWNLLVLCVMLIHRRHRKYHGETTLLYLGGYGLGRCMIESLRTDQLHIPGTTLAVSQLLAGALLIFALLAWFKMHKKPRNMDI